MARSTAGSDRRALVVSQDEALALLDLCLLADTDDSPVRAQLMAKLGQLCRDFMRSHAPEGDGRVIRHKAGKLTIRTPHAAADAPAGLSLRCA